MLILVYYLLILASKGLLSQTKDVRLHAGKVRQAIGVDPVRVLLVAPEEPGFRALLMAWLGPASFLRWASDSSQAWNHASQGRFDRILVHPYIQGEGGLKLARRLRHAHRSTAVSLVMSHPGPEFIRLCKERGLDWIDLAQDETRELVADFPPRSATETIPLRSPRSSKRPWWFQGPSDVGRRFEDETRWASHLNDPLLLLADEGATPARVARWIHEEGARRSGPFIHLDARPLDLGQATQRLCGFVQGAFKGAVETVEGAIEAAHQGTLFIEGVPPGEHVFSRSLMRTIESGEVTRIGGRGPIRVDVRLVTSTPPQHFFEILRPLRECLSTILIRIPPLRQRIGDVPAMARHLLDGLLNEGSGVGQVLWSPGARRALKEYPYPGNESDLETIISQVHAAVRSGSFTGTIPGWFIVEKAPPVDRPLESPMVPLDRVDHAFVRETVVWARGRKGRAARVLGMTRKSLYNHLLKLSRVDWDRSPP